MSNQPTRRDRDAEAKARAFRREAERKRGRDAMRAKAARKTASRGRPTLAGAFYDRILASHKAWIEAGGVGDGPLQKYQQVVDRIALDRESPVRIGNLRTGA